MHLSTTIAGGSRLEFTEAGDYFRLMEATAPLTVEFYHQGRMVSKAEDVGAGYAERFTGGRSFDRFVIASTTGQVVKIATRQGGEVFYDTPPTGVVSMIDGEKARTLAGGMFGGSVAIAGASGVYSNVQLWNPAGNTKNLIVSQLDVIDGTAAIANPHLFLTSAALSTIYSNPPQNKKSGGALPSAELRIENNATPATYPQWLLKNVQLQASGIFTWNIKGALVIAPGWGLRIFNLTVNSTIGANLEWFEELI
jgi:hypothetical protein